MRTVIVLSEQQLKKFLQTRELTDVVIMNIKDKLKDGISKILEENTGYSSKPVIGISSLYGNRVVLDKWKSLSSIVSMKASDFILEFNIPDDLVATISYFDLKALDNENSTLLERISNSLNLEGHCEDGEIELAISPILKYDFCTRYVHLNDKWQVEDIPIIANKNELSIDSLERFGGVK